MGKGVVAGLRSCLPAAALMLATPASGEPFRWQIDGALQHGEFGRNVELEDVGLNATYFFGSVDDTVGPVSLAPFLSRSSSMTWRAQYTQQTSTILVTQLFTGVQYESSTRYESKLYGVDGRKVWRGSGWFVGGGITILDPGEPTNLDIDSHGLAVTVGKYVARNTSVAASISRSRSVTEGYSAGCPSPSCYGPYIPPSLFEATTDTDTKTLSVTHVGGERGKVRYSVAGRLSHRDMTSEVQSTPLAPENQPPFDASPYPGGVVYRPISVPLVREPTETVEITGTIYPTSRLGIRLGYTAIEEGSADYRTEIGTRWFFRSGMAIDFALGHSEAGNYLGSRDTDEAIMRLIGRF